MTFDLHDDRLDYIFRNMDDAVCITGKTGKLLFFNPAAQALFGFAMRKDARIWDAIPYVKGNDRLIQLFIDAIQESRGAAHSFVDYYSNSGRRYRLQVHLTYRPDDPPMFLIVISDQTKLDRVQSAFSRYTSPEIAEYVLSTPEGERRGGHSQDVTILMSDLRGFSALNARCPGGDMITLLNHYFERMSEIIAQHHGTVIEFLGDGIFTVFGAPDDLPGHAAWAVRCAIGMQNAMTGVNAWNREKGYPELQMGIGVNSGEAVVGNIGSELRMKYGCVGQAVNLAGRLEGLAVGGQIYISEYTRARITEKLDITDEKLIFPKGVGHEIRICDVAGIGEDCVLVPSHTSDWLELPAPIPVRCYRLDDKNVCAVPSDRSLTRLTRDEKAGMLVPSAGIGQLENLMIRHGGNDYYAKVLRLTPEGAEIRFTSSPAPLLPADIAGAPAPSEGKEKEIPC